MLNFNYLRYLYICEIAYANSYYLLLHLHYIVLFNLINYYYKLFIIIIIEIYKFMKV